MARRTFTRYRTLPRLGAERGPMSRFLSVSSTVVLWLVGLALAGGLVYYPRTWAIDQTSAYAQPWLDRQWPLLDRIERDWQTLVLPPPFTTGQEPEVAQYLKQNRLVAALRDRTSGKLWVRSGETLVPGPQHPAGIRYLGWFQMAEQSPTFQWFPPHALNPEVNRTPLTLLTTDRWMALKRWEMGSPEVEAHLRTLIPIDSQVRVGLKPENMEHWKQRESWGTRTLQMDPFRISQGGWIAQEAKTNAFGDGWQIGVYPTPAENNHFYFYMRRKLFTAYGLAALLGLGVLYGTLMRARARQRAALESDRLASLTHSLKTPLAILKFRCDSLRLGRLSPDQTDEQLLKLGAEVDHLTLVIDSGLRAIKGDESSGPTGEATPAFLREVALDLEPAFESEDRDMELLLAEEVGEANLPTLRSALATLLENALAHGAGKVTLETRRVRNSLTITVRDQGPGLTDLELEALGKPFQRFRTSEQEGFHREGLGLGLSLLIQMAEREGWGLAFDSQPGQGLTAELRIRLRGRHRRFEAVLEWFHSRSIPIPLESK